MKRPRALHKHENTKVRQRQIVEAARRLIIRYGSEHVTVRRIAAEVGFSEGAIYRHFKSKKDILALLADHIEETLLEDIAHSGVTAKTPLETLDLVLRSHLSAVEQRRGISFQVIAEIVSLGDKELNRRISETIDKYIRQIKGFLQEALKAGQVRDDIDLEAAAMLLFGMIQGLVNIWALSNYSFNPEERYAPLWEIFRKAIAAQ